MSENEKSREELSEQALTQVSGGAVATQPRRLTREEDPDAGGESAGLKLNADPDGGGEFA